MKKKYLLGLIPAVLLSSCIGPNWQVDIKKAIQVTKGIVAKQNAESFKMPENFRYYTETFRLTRKIENQAITTESERNSYTFDIDTIKYFFRYEYTQTAHTEGSPAKQDKTTIRWYFFDAVNKKIYDVSDLGTADSRTYTVTILGEEEEFDSEKFGEHIKEILSGKDQFDYKGQDFIDPQKTQDDTDELNAVDGVSSEVKFFSRYEHSYSNEVETKYKDFLDDEGYLINGNLRESYGWENYYFCTHSLTSDITKTKGNIDIQQVDNKTFELTIFNSKTSIEFNYPELKNYKLIEEIHSSGNEENND